MTIQQLKCFVVMAEVLHYTKAANILYISQPSLSYSISELEKELNLRLFERMENKTSITEYGAQLLPYAKEILAKTDKMKVKANELLDPYNANVNLGNIYSISFDFIPQLLEKFYSNKDNSNITVSCMQGVNKNLVDGIMSGNLDIMLSGCNENKDINAKYVFTQQLKLIVSKHHKLAKEKNVCLEDISQDGLISLGENSNITNHIKKCFAQKNLKANFVLKVAECSAMGAFISSGMAIAIAPIVPSFYNTNVKIIPFCAQDSKLLGRKIYLQWAKTKHLSPASNRLKNFILENLIQI